MPPRYCDADYYKAFIGSFAYEPTSCQDRLFHSLASFLSGDDGDIFVVNGYAGTGKTSALSAVINALLKMRFSCVLLAPTGRAAKVLSRMSGQKAITIHKGIYRQKGVGDNGWGQFTLAPNKARHSLFVVDEASLIGISENRDDSHFGSGNLLEDLVSFVRSGDDCRLVLLGDSAQLPPVGMESSPALNPYFMEFFGGVSYETLDTVVRQAAESGILQNATFLRRNLEADTLKLRCKDFPDMERLRGDELIDALVNAYDTYGEDETIVLCRSNKRAIRYNMGIRSMVQYKEERLLRGDKLMIVKNCYQFLPEESPMDYMANGDVAELVKIGDYEQRYGLNFAQAKLRFPDYDDLVVDAKICLDTLESESAALTAEQHNALYEGVSADYSHIGNKRKRYNMVREDPYYNALQIKYAQAVTCHKAQGGQWDCVFIDCPFWADEFTSEDFKWLYTAFSRAVKKVYLVNFPDRYFVD